MKILQHNCKNYEFNRLSYWSCKFPKANQRAVTKVNLDVASITLLLTVMSIVGQGLLQIIVVLGVSGGIGASRTVRSAVIGVKENDYFLAARALGTPTSRILIRHVLPNIMAPIIIIFSINIGGVIIAEASLSFLGFGLPIEISSWGDCSAGKDAGTWSKRPGWRFGLGYS